MIAMNLPADGLRRLSGWFTKQLFLPAYEAADDAYWRDHGSQCEWRSLGGLLEYDPNFLTVAAAGGETHYLMALKAAPNLDLRQVTVKLKVKKSGGIYQQTITIDRLCKIPVRKALTGIPLKPRPKKSVQGRRLGKVYVKLVHAIDGDGVDLIGSRKITDFFESSYSESPLQCYAGRWGQYWNIDQINLEKQKLRTQCYRRLVQSAGQLWRPLSGRRTLYRMLTCDFGLSLAFWSRNLRTAKAMRSAGGRDGLRARPAIKGGTHGAGLARAGNRSQASLSV